MDTDARPLEANSLFLSNACLLLCATDVHKWTGWDKFTAAMAAFNIAFYVFRVVRMRRWEKREAVREREHRATCPICKPDLNVN